MSSEAPATFKSLFDFVLETLANKGCIDLVVRILETVQGGVLDFPKESDGGKSVRKMKDEEAFGIALGLLLSSASVPLMAQDAIKTIGCSSIRFNADPYGIDSVETAFLKKSGLDEVETSQVDEKRLVGGADSLPQLSEMQVTEISDYLKLLVATANELKINIPGVLDGIA